VTGVTALILLVLLLQTNASFTVNFVTVVPFFKVTETIPFNSSTQMGRRDLRSGKQTASAKRTAEGVTVEMEWGAPMAG
jgi:hypothetical protein